LQKELKVVDYSLTRFNTDVALFLAKEGWGESYYGDREVFKEKNQQAEELKQKYIKNQEKVKRGWG
jgi:hypothetical protein